MARSADVSMASALLIALGLSPALGYATTFVVLALAGLAAVLLIGGGAERGAPLSPALPVEWRVRATDRVSPALMFAIGWLMIVASALATVRTPADLVPLFGFSGLLLYVPVARFVGGARLGRYAVLGACVGLATALLYHFGFGMRRAGEGFWLTDPYRLAVTTLLCALLALPLLRHASRDRWLAVAALAAALVTIWLTGSRSALLGAAVLIGASMLVLFRSRLVWAMALGSAGLLGAALLFVELPGTARQRLWDVLFSPRAAGTGPDAALDIRGGLYRAGLELFSRSPLVGHGWGEATMEKARLLLSTEQLSWGRVAHLHNDALQFAVSGGLLGLFAYLLLLLAPFLAWLRLSPAARTPQRLQALLVLVGGALVLGLADTFLAAPLTLTLYLLIGAAALELPAPRDRRPPPPPAG